MPSYLPRESWLAFFKASRELLLECSLPLKGDVQFGSEAHMCYFPVFPQLVLLAKVQKAFPCISHPALWGGCDGRPSAAIPLQGGCLQGVVLHQLHWGCDASCRTRCCGHRPFLVSFKCSPLVLVSIGLCVPMCTSAVLCTFAVDLAKGAVGAYLLPWLLTAHRFHVAASRFPAVLRHLLL